jgi:hypothetical protein
MDANERGRKRRETAAPELDSVPPPRRRKVRNELDPEMLWDKETDEESEEFEADDDGFDSEDGESSEDNYSEDLDDWDHPIRRLKIN